MSTGRYDSGPITQAGPWSSPRLDFRYLVVQCDHADSGVVTVSWSDKSGPDRTVQAGTRAQLDVGFVEPSQAVVVEDSGGGSFTGRVLADSDPITERVDAGAVVTAAVTGNVGITGTPTVAVPASSNPTNPATGSTFTQRNVSAQSVASAAGNSGTTTTVIAAPGAAAYIELHTVSFAVGDNATSAQLIRSDNSAVIAQLAPNSSSLQYNTSTLTIDLQGATLPANVGVKLKLTGASGGSVTVAYSVVQ